MKIKLKYKIKNKNVYLSFIKLFLDNLFIYVIYMYVILLYKLNIHI